MPQRQTSVRRAGSGLRVVCGAAVALATLTLAPGCEDRNRGVSPDGVGLYFPAGVALDPRVPAYKRARWMFVLNANSDLVYNAGTLAPVDLRGFFAAWMLDAERCFGTLDDPNTPDVDETVAGDPAFCGPGPCPGCEPLAGAGDAPRVGDVGAELTEAVPCRRNAYKPQVVECEDSLFIEQAAAVHIGNFGTALRGWTERVVTEPEREGHLFAAVRGDPSITWVRLSDNALEEAKDPTDEVPTLDCGQGVYYDATRCGGKLPVFDGAGALEAVPHLLTYLRNDDGTIRLASEPSNILAVPGDPYVLVTHATRPAVTMIDMRGQLTRGGEDDGELRPDGIPAITQMRSVFSFGGVDGGGWGLARRPCDPDNAPELSFGKDANGEPVACARPLIYAGFRTALYITRLFIAAVEPLKGTFDEAWIDGVLAKLEDDRAGADAAERALLDDQIAYYEGLKNGLGDQQCLLAEDIYGDALADDDESQPLTEGRFLCDAKLFGAGLFRAAAWDTGTTSGTAQLGDMAFSRDGERLFAVQTNPGGLAYVDTSLDEFGRTRDQSAGVIELCASPTALTLFYAGDQEYAAVTCYSPSEMFIVDLGQVRVVGNVALGRGPHPMVVDPARDLMYIANTLDKTVSVVDLSPKRVTRFAEIARLGRQVPYNR
ncbi:MAG: hypothetical protein JNL82_38745 [Myxococcales bacterium]|nr:hypothetical protein [Myxococcales bacterium]